MGNTHVQRTIPFRCCNTIDSLLFLLIQRLKMIRIKGTRHDQSLLKTPLFACNQFVYSEAYLMRVLTLKIVKVNYTST